MLFREDIEIVNTSTCYVVSFDDVKQVQKVDLKLKNRDSLKPGDRFTQLGLKGCSYKQPIVMADGWVQSYEGVVSAIIENAKITSFILFSAQHIEDSRSALDSWDMRFKNKHLAYVQYSNLALGYYGSNDGYHFFDTDFLMRA